MAEKHEPNSESDRILKRVERETAGGGLIASGAMATSKTPADEDWIEYWGTRIGRMIGLVVAGALLAWIVLYALNLI